MTSQLRIGICSLAAALLAWASPLSASAQAITGHELTLVIRTASQGETNNGQDRIDRSTEKNRDLFQLCQGNTPTRTQKIFLILDCADLNNNDIAAVDLGTTPVDGLVSLGGVTFDLDHLMQVTKNDQIRSVRVPVEINLACNAGALDAALFGIADLQYARVSAGGPICPRVGSVRITGVGMTNTEAPPEFIVDDGSLIKIGRPNPAITAFPAF